MENLKLHETINFYRRKQNLTQEALAQKYGDVSCGDNVACGDNITGDVTCGGSVECKKIEGDVQCQGNVIYK